MKRGLYLPVLTFVGITAAAVVVGCSMDSGGPSLNPQPLPPNHPPEGERQEELPPPSASHGGVDRGSDDGETTAGEPPAEPSADAGDGSP